MWTYNYADELYHHGIKGMKWGRRRYQNPDGSLTPAGRKRYAKEEFERSKASAKKTYRKALETADSQYEKDMAKRTKALEKVKKTYDTKDAETERYYKGELEKHQRNADKVKAEMDFWEDPDSGFYQDAASRYSEINKQIQDIEVRRDSVMMANKIARDNANIKVRELYADNAETAANKRNAAYVQAGKEYTNSVLAAKKTYKDVKQAIKNDKKAAKRGR